MKAKLVEPTLEWLRTNTVVTDSGCWENPNSTAKDYWQIYWNGQVRPGHRAAWKAKNGEIPDGLCVCHRCNNKRCVNPDHLYLGTRKQNIQDAARDRLMRGPLAPKPSGITQENAAKTHCKRGHLFTPENTMASPPKSERARKLGRVHRRCRACEKVHRGRVIARWTDGKRVRE